MHFRQKLLLSVALVLFLCCKTSSAPDTSSEGEQWLRWSDETRLAYVTGYVLGFGKGFHRGCQIGEETYSDKLSGLPGERCLAKIPNESKSPEEYAEIITNYYRLYPADRYVSLLRLLDGLQRMPDLTIQKMHEYYPSSAKVPQKVK
jgi:hypothetical protein